MIITVACRTPCPICGYLLGCYAFPPVTVNKRSLRQRPGSYLRTNPGRCPECGFDACMPPPVVAQVFTVSPWRLHPKSAAQVQVYRLRRWPELAGEAA